MTVVGISGHMDLTVATRRRVAAALAHELADAGDDLVGLTSLARGADQVFAWAVLAAGGRLVFVQPCADIASTWDGPDPLVRAHAEALAGLASETVRLPYDAPSEEAFLAAGLHVADRCQRLLAVWDGGAAGGRGGTADVVAHCERIGRPWTRVWPAGSARG